MPAMNLSQFRNSLANPKPPPGLAPALTALWWAAKDKWEKAHNIVMDEGGKDCAWVHAYLHRVEGDLECPLLVRARATPGPEQAVRCRVGRHR